MFPRVIAVRHLREYWLELTFADGQKGRLDFRERITGRRGPFAALQDVDFFKQVQVDPEAGTLVWPNDLDLDPDVLYCAVMGIELPEPEQAQIPA
ncbi:MAG: DUF2442 domain-containing protein [Caldilineaceae bacterium]|nr:DUF2442 domain-containing protein [Caldilineaceae bacterium]